MILFASLHILAAAVLATALSNWVHLAGKGWKLGWDQMDLGDDDLPTISVAQLFEGLALSASTWMVLLGLVLLTAIIVADWRYRRDKSARATAWSRACALTIWMPLWSVGFLFALGYRDGQIVQPARWPDGETWEARARLVFLLAVYLPWWAAANAGIAPARLSIRFGRALMALAICGLIWLALWRGLPWVAIEAFTG